MSAVKITIYVFIITLLCIACSPHPQANNNPINGLIGKWSLTGDFLDLGKDTSLFIQINDAVLSDEKTSSYNLSGCMQTEEGGGWAPLAMKAIKVDEDETYQINIISTLLLPQTDYQTAIIRFTGDASLSPNGMDDDLMEGDSYSILGKPSWKASHTSSDIVDCPEALSEGLSFMGEVQIRRDLASTPPFDVTNYISETNIASANLQVELPDGSVLEFPFETDIYSPHVDYIDVFRFSGHVEGTPILDKPYTFRLLDHNGNPIPGVESTDRYLHCEHGAPTNLEVNYENENYLELNWDAPDIIPGIFDPENGNGFYLISLQEYPGGSEALYGATAFQPTHLIPWKNFIPGGAGLPDGFDYGVSLSELDNGEYFISISAQNFYDPQEGDEGYDCGVLDSSEDMVIEKIDGIIN
jgi:hypothetical protein